MIQLIKFKISTSSRADAFESSLVSHVLFDAFPSRPWHSSKLSVRQNQQLSSIKTRIHLKHLYFKLVATEAISTAIMDEFMPVIKERFKFKYFKEALTAIIVSLSFLCGIPMITNVNNDSALLTSNQKNDCFEPILNRFHF